MKYKILSTKRNKIKIIVGLLPLILFVILGIIDISGFYINKILLISLIIYLLLPLSIVKNKIIGDLELTNYYISFFTEQSGYIKIDLPKIKHCKLKYLGAKGNIHLMARGWSWESGNSFFEIQTKDTVYKVIFLSESIDDENELISYTEVLKRNNISYDFSLKNRKYR